MRRYGQAEQLVTDRLCAYGAALKEIGFVDNTAGQRIHICLFDDVKERYFVSGACGTCKGSSPSMPQPATIST